MEHIIVGTAGHIDHGKTALVKALTGHDTDTLAEEKKRGISINLGFTSFRLPGGRTLGIVDVPGHEKFIKNMLAGATGIDVALIVVAANEGIMPQTQEHIDILSYLNIQKSLIVLTKIDMVDDEFKELVIEDIESYIEGTFLAGARIVEVDSISGRGIPALIEELEQLTADVGKRSYTRKPRMNIDRVFSIKGHGTVVTGTLMEGVIHEEDEMVIYPAGLPVRVRNLQVHEQDVTAAYAGQRTAINLSGVSVADIKRGDTIAAVDGLYVTDCIDVKFSIVKNTKFEFTKFYKMKLYVGASEEVVRFVPVSIKKAKAGDSGYGQILLDDKIAVLKGDRFVLRTISPVTTVGGGIIIDPQPVRYKKITDSLIESLRLKDLASEEEIAEQYIKSHPFTSYEAVAGFLNRDFDRGQLTKLAAEGVLLEFNHSYIHLDSVLNLRFVIESCLRGYHATNPLRYGMPKAELSEKSGIPDKKQFEFLLDYMMDEQVLKMDKNLIALDQFEPQLTAVQQQIQAEFLRIIEEGHFSLANVKELTVGDKEKQKVLEFILLDDGYIILPGQYILERRLYDKARTAAAALYDEFGVIRLSEFRDLIGASRKYALMILEKLDQEKITRRQGEDRVLINK